jgi:hypothetical protein
MRALYALERCLLAAIEYVDIMPCQVFSNLVFHSCLESISFNLDRPIDEQLVSEVKKLFLEGTMSAFPDGSRNKGPIHNPVLPINKHKEDIFNTVICQRVTIIHEETSESPFF